jgi:RNA polymerase sigma-70 factor, ECF subfamily
VTSDRLRQAADALNEAVERRLEPRQRANLDSVVRAASSGDEDAFEELWQRLGPGLLRYLTILAPDAVEDLAAETRLQVLRGVGQFEGDESAFRAWMFTIARHQAVHRQHRRSRSEKAAVAASRAPLPEASDTAAGTISSHAVTALIAALPTNQAEVVMLRVMTGLDVDQVAAIVGKRPRTVRSLTHRGLRQLAGWLQSKDLPERPEYLQPSRSTERPGAQRRSSYGVLIADQNRTFAVGLGVMLDAQDDLTVLGVAHDSHQAVELAATHEPIVLLLDAHMSGSDLASTLRAVKAASPATRVLIVSADTRKESIAAALGSGADGFLAKDASSRQVAGAIRSLVEGRTGMVVTAEPLPRPTRDPSINLRIRTLSGREREILGLLASGWSNRRIADECFLSLNAVRTHVQNILIKLGVHSKLEAVGFALEHGLVLLERERVEPAAEGGADRRSAQARPHHSPEGGQDPHVTGTSRYSR